MCTLADKIKIKTMKNFQESNRYLIEIMKDYKASRLYLAESQETTSARARRCLNLVQNVDYLLERTPAMIAVSAKMIGSHGFFGIKGLSNVEAI